MQASYAWWLSVKSQARYFIDLALHSPVALQIVSLLSLVLIVRYWLEPAMAKVYDWLTANKGEKVVWRSSKMYFLFRDIFEPMEGLLLLCVACRMVDGVIGPLLLQLPPASLARFTHPLLSVSLVVASAFVLLNWQRRFFAELAFKQEMEGQTMQQQRLEAVGHVMAVATVIIAIILGLQSVRGLKELHRIQRGYRQQGPFHDRDMHVILLRVGTQTPEQHRCLQP
ncbi:hypothetical protein CYMTET_54363 [Cymbomonas tetramitiformis]|uniref:Uncharacterized protein n=1 Tax=Cymbomonas tetramitiformis TaxID=36881 RepID=A0AAE0EQT4_9CHLO|nr:hypothetical protein CYMTET_54363 [Cymbomonas tetramitiformis]